MVGQTAARKVARRADRSAEPRAGPWAVQKVVRWVVHLADMRVGQWAVHWVGPRAG